MKSKRIIDSWNKIEPDNAAQKRMLSNVLSHAEKSASFAGKEKMNRKNTWKYAGAIAAVVVVAVCAAIIIPVLSGNQSNINVVENLPINTASDMSEPNKSALPQESDANDTVQNRIIAQQEFGVVSLCARSPVEVQSTAINAGVPPDKLDEVACYEDDMYTYIFYDDGTPAGILATYMVDGDYDSEFTKEKKSLSEKEAISLATAALKKYTESYSEEAKDRFKMEVWHMEEEDMNGYPIWQLTFTEYTPSGIRRNYLSVWIDMFGNVAEVTFGIRSDFIDEELDALETIDREQAISLAIAQIKKEGHEFELDDFTVKAELFDFKNTLWWEIILDEKPEVADEFPRGFAITLNAVTGEPMGSVDTLG